MNIKLSRIIEQVQQGNFYDWTRDFDLFKNTINSTTETAKSRFEKALTGKLLNKSVLVKASKSQPKQPIKDYTINRVTNVSIVDYWDNWTVVLKNEFNKEYCLVVGFKIKVLGSAVAAEPGAATVPQEPEPTAVPQAKPQQQPVQAPVKQAPKALPAKSLYKESMKDKL